MPMETSHIWLGVLPSEPVLDEYFEETYSEDDDDSPISSFAEDQGEGFYDHDWVERSFNKSGNQRLLMKRHSYSDDYIDQVIDTANDRGILTANTFIMADVAEFSNPRSIEGDDYKIWCLGQYACRV